MEREPSGPVIDKNEDKLDRLVNVIFDMLWCNLHSQSETHEAFVVNAVSDSIYKMGPLLWTGKISAAAKQALDEGKLIRAQLCKEHPVPRKTTANFVINTFDQMSWFGASNCHIKSELKTIVRSGCQINRVLSEENIALVPFQKMGLDAAACYQRAGIVLVDDIREPEREYFYRNKAYKTQPEIARDLNISITTVRAWIKRGQITVERKVA